MYRITCLKILIKKLEHFNTTPSLLMENYLKPKLLSKDKMCKLQTYQNKFCLFLSIVNFQVTNINLIRQAN